MKLYISTNHHICYTHSDSRLRYCAEFGQLCPDYCRALGIPHAASDYAISTHVVCVRRGLLNFLSLYFLHFS